MRKVLNRMKIGEKLISSFGIIVLLYVITVLAAGLGIHSVSNTLRDFYNKPIQVVYTTQNMATAIQGSGRTMLLASTEGGSAEREEHIEKVSTYFEVMDTGIEKLEKSYTGDKDKLDNLAELLKELRPYRNSILELLKQGRSEEALNKYQTYYEPLAATTREALDDMNVTATQEADEEYKVAAGVEKKIITSIIILAVVIIVLSTLIWLVIARSITEPIRLIQKAANRVAEGDLSVELSYNGTDELGELAENIRQTVQALKLYVSEIENGLTQLGNGKLNYRTDVEFQGDFIAIRNAVTKISQLLRSSFQQISSSAEQVAGGAEQVSNGAQILSQGASEQAGSIEELAASINEISDSVQSNAENAVSSSKLADSVGCKVLDSSEQMRGMIEAIEQIRRDSQEIKGIVREIEDIAFQTNILALNASVEAARAGDAGRGFSVVANEVRRLAAKSSEASKMTASLASKTTNTIEEGIKAARETEASLNQVVAGTQEVNGMVDRISEMSVQQATAITQIRQSIEAIADIVQGNSATSEESAAASEELSAQAQLLKNLVEQFEL